MQWSSRRRTSRTTLQRRHTLSEHLFVVLLVSSRPVPSQTFHAVPCLDVHVDAMDVAGENQLDIDHDMIKQRLSPTGEDVGEPFTEVVSPFLSRRIVAVGVAITAEPVEMFRQRRDRTPRLVSGALFWCPRHVVPGAGCPHRQQEVLLLSRRVEGMLIHHAVPAAVISPLAPPSGAQPIQSELLRGASATYNVIPRRNIPK